MSESEPEDEDLPDLDPEDEDDASRLTSFMRDRMPPGFARMMSTVQQENGLAKVMMKPVYVPDENGEPQVSQAEVIADCFNILRLDNKALGEAAGLDLRVNRMTPEKAAILLQDAIKGENLDLIEEFAREEERREAVLEALTDTETLQEHQEVKQRVSYFFQAAEGVTDE